MKITNLISYLHAKLVPVATKCIACIEAIHYYLISINNYFRAEHDLIDFKGIPIIINNFNRVTYLRELIESLKSKGYHNIYIIDNNSTYPPLLEYYKICNCTVYRLKNNLGYKAFILSGIYKQFANKYFVYTDSDIYLPDDCPDDILEYFYRLLTQFPFVSKVGCALRIDNLPDCYKHKEQVQKWESKFWQNEIIKDVYLARLDTTFTLYKPNYPVGSSMIGNNLRVAGKYLAIHRPWYLDSNHLDDEEMYYLSSATTSTFWSKQSR